jgi:hypothetical protein
MAEDESHTLTFLYKIVDDNQETIRFLDTKAGFGIAVLGAIVGKVLFDQDQLTAFKSHGPMVLALSVAFALVVVLSAFLGFKTVHPTINPAQNVSFPDDLEPKFFIYKFSCCRFLRLFSNSKKFATLETTHTAYCAALRESTPEKLESIVAAEVLKLSFIRQMKMDRLRAFAWALIVTVILFTALMFVPRKGTAEVAPQPNRVCSSTAQGPRDIYNYNSPQQPSK